MKTAGIKRVMKSLGCTANVPSRIKELKTINLRSDGNQSVTPEDDEITFDADNELIKIKEYDASLVSGLVSLYTIDGKELHDCRISTSIRFRQQPIPKNGDILVYISKTDSTVKTVGKVVYMLSKTIAADSELPDPEGYYIGYVDADAYADAKQYVSDPRFFVKYTPVTDFDTDIYIDFAAVAGFSTITPYFGI